MCTISHKQHTDTQNLKIKCNMNKIKYFSVSWRSQISFIKNYFQNKLFGKLNSVVEIGFFLVLIEATNSYVITVFHFSCGFIQIQDICRIINVRCSLRDSLMVQAILTALMAMPNSNSCQDNERRFPLREKDRSEEKPNLKTNWFETFLQDVERQISL